MKEDIQQIEKNIKADIEKNTKEMQKSKVKVSRLRPEHKQDLKQYCRNVMTREMSRQSV